MKLARAAFAAVLFFIMLNTVHASTLLYDIVSTGSAPPDYSNEGGDWGFEFTPSQNMTADALGLWDEQNDFGSASYTIGLWNSENVLLASTSVNSSSTMVASTNTFGEWAFSNLTSPVSLTGGQDYVLGYFSNHNDAAFIGSGTNYADFTSGTYVASEANASALIFTTPAMGGSGSTPNGWFGPNLSTAAVGVPEPSSIALLASERRRLSASAIGDGGSERTQSASAALSCFLLPKKPKFRWTRLLTGAIAQVNIAKRFEF